MSKQQQVKCWMIVDSREARCRSDARCVKYHLKPTEPPPDGSAEVMSKQVRATELCGHPHWWNGQDSPLREATQEEIDAQRESWVRGEAAMGSDADEARERAALRNAAQERTCEVHWDDGLEKWVIHGDGLFALELGSREECLSEASKRGWRILEETPDNRSEPHRLCCPKYALRRGTCRQCEYEFKSSCEHPCNTCFGGKPAYSNFEPKKDTSLG